jgi:uncharacterized protein YciI
MRGGERTFLVRMGDRRPGATTPELIWQHVQWLRRLHGDSRLVACGPCDDGTAIIILRGSTLEEARKVAFADPFRAAGAVGVYEVVEIRLANPENDFLLNG